VGGRWSFRAAAADCQHCQHCQDCQHYWRPRRVSGSYSHSCLFKFLFAVSRDAVKIAVSSPTSFSRERIFASVTIPDSSVNSSQNSDSSASSATTLIFETKSAGERVLHAAR
jgi:hypothetical protein